MFQCLQNVLLATQGYMWLQHDRAPPHFCTEVTEFLNKNYEGKWTARKKKSGLSTQSLNLNQFDSFCKLHKGKSVSWL